MSGVRAGQQQVLDRGSLKGAIVRGAQQQPGRGQIPGHAKPWTGRVLLHQQTVAIPAQPGAEREISLADQVLDESRLLAVLPAIGKTERARRVVVEYAHAPDAEGRDAVVEALMDGAEDGVRAGFPLMHAVVPGDRSPRVGFPKASLLCRQDGRRKRVRP